MGWAQPRKPYLRETERINEREHKDLVSDVYLSLMLHSWTRRTIRNQNLLSIVETLLDLTLAHVSITRLKISPVGKPLEKSVSRSQ